MKYKKLLAVGSAVLVLSITGLTVAATHSNPQIKAHSVQSVAVQKDSTDNDVTVDSTETAPLDTPTVPTSTTTPSAQVDETATVVTGPTPLEQFHNTITAQSQALAPLFASQYFPTEADFISMQWACIGASLDDSVSQSDLDAKAGFLVPQTVANGTAYQFFTGGCRVVQLVR